MLNEYLRIFAVDFFYRTRFSRKKMPSGTQISCITLGDIFMSKPLKIQDEDNKKIERRKQASKLVAKASRKIKKEFQKHSRIKADDEI